MNYIAYGILIMLLLHFAEIGRITENVSYTSNAFVLAFLLSIYWSHGNVEK